MKRLTLGESGLHLFRDIGGPTVNTDNAEASRQQPGFSTRTEAIAKEDAQILPEIANKQLICLVRGRADAFSAAGSR